MNLVIILAGFGLPLISVAQDASLLNSTRLDSVEVQQPLKPFRFITNIPVDELQIFMAPCREKNEKWFLISVGATLALLPLDQAIANGINHFSAQIHLSPDTKYEIPIRFDKTKILKVSQNINSGLYQLGEGGTSMAIAGGLYLFGKKAHNEVALHTASDLTETFFTMGITTQIMKRIGRRESPFLATKPGGAWQLSPGFQNFAQNTSAYDEFPSRHLATMAATVSTLLLNYPEKQWLKPVGYSLIGLKGFAMINTDAHWISDYTLALAVGYISAKITYLKNRPKVHKQLASFNMSLLSALHPSLADSNTHLSMPLRSLVQSRPFTYRSFIAPAAMVAYGFISLKSYPLEDIKEDVKRSIWTNNPDAPWHIDNYLQFAPAVTVYALNITGIKGKSNFRDRTMIYLISNIFLNTTVSSVKRLSKEERPDGSSRAYFPSDHTAEAFASAEFLRQEYQEVSPWYGIAGYETAPATGVLRMYNNKHWPSDVIAGAGVSMASARLAYLVNQAISKALFKKSIQMLC